MSAVIESSPEVTTGPSSEAALLGTAPASAAGPIEPEELAQLRQPPRISWPRAVQVVWFGQRQWNFVFHHRQKLGEVWHVNGYVRGGANITAHPDHIQSLFKAPTDLITTLATESPLRPVLGPNSVLTANGPRHLRQRKLLLPPFHGEAIAHYERMIADAADREIARWPVGSPVALAPRMQAITLDVIMGGIFGIEGKPRVGTLEHALRTAIRHLLYSSTAPGAKLAELMNIGHDEPFGLTWIALLVPDRLLYALIAKRRRARDLEERGDIMSLLMRSRTEPDDSGAAHSGEAGGRAGGEPEGEALSDRELRDELMTLVLAGHETTANQLAWTWERLVRNPEAHERLLDTVRSDAPDADEVVEATITEAMRVRPVIPMTGRRVTVPWRLGEYGIPADTAVGISILLLHHRGDLYPRPFEFRPERWLTGRKQPDDPGDAQSGEAGRRAGVKPGTYEWIPFGGGTRRCLGAALAMAEQRVVLRAMAERLDLEAIDPRPERPRNRNVTMIPARGGRVVVRSRR